jgi:hypothetical protein
MPRPNFFNDNINRTFPFQWATAGVATPDSGSVTMLQLPDEFIADCGFIMGPESGFEEGTHNVFLYKVTRVTATEVTYEFRSDVQQLLDAPLVFTRNINDPTYTSEFVESILPGFVPFSLSLSGSASEPTPEVFCGEPYWTGYLVTGPMAAVAARLGIGQSIIRGSSAETLVEPALIQNLNLSQLVSLSTANSDRTRALRPPDCPPNHWQFPTGIIYVNRECLQGNLRFRSGYNMAVNQNNLTNTLQFAAIVNAGLGEPCAEVKLFAEETPPTGSPNNLLEGDFYCNEVLRSINGLQGPNLTFFAGNGVAITADSANNKVIVDINLQDLSLCAYSTVSESI